MAAASGTGVGDGKQNRRWFDELLEMLIESELEKEKVIFPEIGAIP